jgi:hypothetical protein
MKCMTRHHQWHASHAAASLMQGENRVSARRGSSGKRVLIRTRQLQSSCPTQSMSSWVHPFVHTWTTATETQK